jgi:hypothetical protein
MALHPDVHPEATKVERARLDAAMAALNQAWDRIEAWHEQDVPPGRTARRARTAPTVPTVRTPPPGFRRIGVAAPYARGDQLELTGESADLLGLTALEGEPVRLLRCTNHRLHDDHLAALGALAALRSLDLDGTGITDRGVEVLTRLPHLADLHLSDTRITDAGLALVARVPQLHSLSVAGTAVTDAGLVALAGHPRLAVLNLRGAAVEGDGLRHLATCPSLRILAVSHVDRHHRRAFAAERPDVTFA